MATTMLENTKLYGGIIGNVIGSPYMFVNQPTDKNFALFNHNEHYTGDTVMMLAIANTLKVLPENAEEDIVKEMLIFNLQTLCNMFAQNTYGNGFTNWLKSENPEPYCSYGSGAASRVAPVGWMYKSLKRTREVAKWTAEISHNHPEGIRGAQAVAELIFYARQGKDKEFLKNIAGTYYERFDEFSYEYLLTLDQKDICQVVVPEAVIVFLNSTDFEDAIRKAVLLGGDTDTLTSIVGSLAEAYYKKIPEKLAKPCIACLESELLEIVNKYN